MAKILQRPCRNGYRHYWVPARSEVTNIGATLPGILEGSREIAWDREIVLTCSRCELTCYLDTVVRTYHGITPGDWLA
jgi:hypothetical protein